MKRIVLSIFAIVAAFSATAQTIPTKAIIVHKSDGQQDTLLLRKTSSISNYFYGKENPVDGDYIELRNFQMRGNLLSYEYRLTNIGLTAPYDAFSVILSSSHIDSAPDINCVEKDGWDYLYLADQKQWNYNWSHSSGWYKENTFYTDKFLLVPGQTYYLRAYYLLDGKVYFSTEESQRFDKTLLTVRNYYYADYTQVNNNVVYKLDADAIFSQHADLLGKQSAYTTKVVQQRVSQVLAAKEEAELAQIATKTEACDDGTLYVFDSLPASVIGEVLQKLTIEASQSMYVQTNLDNVLAAGTNSNTYFRTYGCVPTIVQTDEKWGIRDNQYLVTKPQGTTSKPEIAFRWNQLMLPGKTYDVTLTLAPNTEDETDSLDVLFNVTIGSQALTPTDYNNNVPTLAEGQTFGTDTVYNKKNLYIARPHEMKVMTMQYQPTHMADLHYLRLGNNPFNFFTAANRARYGREFRVVGFEVKPHEEE